MDLNTQPAGSSYAHYSYLVLASFPGSPGNEANPVPQANLVTSDSEQLSSDGENNL